MSYDSNNIFAKILRGEISCQKVFEDESVLAFHDINAKAPIHILVIPKGPYKDIVDFCTQASPNLISHFFKVTVEISESLGLSSRGFRLINNCGVDGGQEVPHFHIHLCGGAKLKGLEEMKAE